MTEPRIVIVAYKPFFNKEKELDELVKKHHNILECMNLVTNRLPVIMRAKQGIIIEVFEWVSAEAIEQAHEDEKVKELWDEFEKVCQYIPIADIEEAKVIFSQFLSF